MLCYARGLLVSVVDNGLCRWNLGIRVKTLSESSSIYVIIQGKLTWNLIHSVPEMLITKPQQLSLIPGGRGGGYSLYPSVGSCGAATHTLTLFKTNIADFPTLFKTELRFFIPCLRHLINIRACKNFAVYLPRKDILFKTKIDKSIPWLRQKMINSTPCLRQKSWKTYPGWPHVPSKPL